MSAGKIMDFCEKLSMFVCCVEVVIFEGCWRVSVRIVLHISGFLWPGHEAGGDLNKISHACCPHRGALIPGLLDTPWPGLNLVIIIAPI